MTGHRWSDLTTGRRRLALLLGTAQLSMATAAWADLARRPAESVNGSKLHWAAIIAINFFGPPAYLRWGRRLDA